MMALTNAGDMAMAKLNGDCNIPISYAKRRDEGMLLDFLLCYAHIIFTSTFASIIIGFCNNVRHRNVQFITYGCKNASANKSQI